MLKCVLERISPFYPKGRWIVMSGTTWRKYDLFLFLYFLYGINEKNKGIEKSRGKKKNHIFHLTLLWQIGSRLVFSNDVSLLQMLTY